MKYCNRCEQNLDVNLFGTSKAKKDGLQVYCKMCMNLYRKEHYKNNKTQYLNRNKQRQETLRKYVNNIKAGSCVDCGITYKGEPWLMEFDHRNPSQKVANVSKLVRLKNKQKVLDEVAKCDLVCANCHRIRTHS